MDIKQFELQKGVRDNCDEFKNTLSDLYKWQEEIKDQEKNKRNDIDENENIPIIRSHVTEQNAKNKKLVNGTAEYESKGEIISEQEPKQNSLQQTEPSKKELANISKEEGNALVKSGNYEDALLQYTEAIKNFDSDSVFYTNRALCFLKLEKYHKCIEDCNIAIKLAPKSIKAFYRRMLAYESLGDMDKSLIDCSKVLNLDPGNLDAKKSQDRIKKRKNNFGFNLSRSFKKISDGNFVLEPTWTEIDGYLKEIPVVTKPPHLRSKKPLKRIPVEEIIADEDTNKNEITDEIIDKLFNSNDCGSFKQIDTKCRTADTKPHKKKIVSLATIPKKPRTQAQFYAAWKELNKEQKYFYLKQIEPANIVKMVGAGFEIENLSEFLSIISEYYLDDHCDVSILVEICKHEEMSILSMFLSDADRQALKNILNYMRKNNYDDSKIQFINTKFGVRY